MNKTDKNMLVGATVTALTDAGLESIWIAKNNMGESLINVFPYITIHKYVPPVDDLIALAGVPTLLYVIGRQKKDSKFIDMAKGGAVYGVSELVGQVLNRVVKSQLTTYVVSR